MSLEANITKGKASYIDSIEHNVVKRLLIIKFLKDPEANAIDRILTFSSIEDFVEEQCNDDDIQAGIKVIDSLIGLHEYKKDESVEYVVHTDLREISFHTKDKPIIEYV